VQETASQSEKVSVVLPTYNEADSIETAVEQVIAALKEYGKPYEIIIAEDGSTDGTNTKASMLSIKHLGIVKHIHKEKRMGRGKALENAFNHSSGNVLVYMDVDLATDVRHLADLVRSVQVEGYEIATGSRMLNESRVRRSGTRNIASRVYNLMVRWLLDSKIKDHQCGFKAFRREPLMQLLTEVEAKHWFWDTEILVRAAQRGYRIKEIPVNWKGGSETKVRLLKDSSDMFRQILVLWWHLKVSRLNGSSLGFSS